MLLNDFKEIDRETEYIAGLSTCAHHSTRTGGGHSSRALLREVVVVDALDLLLAGGVVDVAVDVVFRLVSFFGHAPLPGLIRSTGRGAPHRPDCQARGTPAEMARYDLATRMN